MANLSGYSLKLNSYRVDKVLFSGKVTNWCFGQFLEVAIWGIDGLGKKGD